MTVPDCATRETRRLGDLGRPFRTPFRICQEPIDLYSCHALKKRSRSPRDNNFFTDYRVINYRILGLWKLQHRTLKKKVTAKRSAWSSAKRRSRENAQVIALLRSVINKGFDALFFLLSFSIFHLTIIFFFDAGFHSRSVPCCTAGAECPKRSKVSSRQFFMKRFYGNCKFWKF